MDEVTPESATKVKLAEHFYTIQGEGKSVGAPAVFLRFSMCNFMCKWCDTVDVWKKGTWYDYDEMDALMRENNYYVRLRKGARLVLTGGDPLIQQASILRMINRWREFGIKTERIFFEVETQGYIQPTEDFARQIRQWNVSPKLSNSGMPKEKRINYDLLRWHAKENSFFKFPVASREDLDEVDEIVRTAQIKQTRVFLMPICSTREQHLEASLLAVNLAKMAGYNYSPRMQLVLWNQVTGV
jgi:7-carboxy-7-deazaguanine synthase